MRTDLERDKQQSQEYMLETSRRRRTGFSRFILKKKTSY